MKLALIILTIFLSMLIACTPGQSPKSVSGLSFDDDGMLIKDGKRTFIVGSYYLPKSDDPYKNMAELGYNLIRVEAKQSELDQAQANGLAVWISIGSIDPANFDKGSQAYRQRIRAHKDHPALLFWEMEDEPAWRWNSAESRVKPEDLIKSYRVIKAEDAKHLVYMNHAPTNLVSTLQKYNPANDIVACDIYPVIPRGIRLTYALFPDGMQGDLLNTYISQVGEYTDKMRAVAGKGKPVFMVLQGFAWEMLREAKDREERMVQYPNYHETRFMAYNAIIHGANGIIYWGTYYTPQPSPFWTNLAAVTKELGSMQEVLAARAIDLPLTKEYHELGHSTDAGVEILAKSVGGTTYLLTANADKNPVQVSLHGLRGFTSATVLSEGRQVKLQGGALTDYYAAFAVHVYKLEK